MNVWMVEWNRDPNWSDEPEREYFGEYYRGWAVEVAKLHAQSVDDETEPVHLVRCTLREMPYPSLLLRALNDDAIESSVVEASYHTESGEYVCGVCGQPTESIFTGDAVVERPCFKCMQTTTFTVTKKSKIVENIITKPEVINYAPTGTM